MVKNHTLHKTSPQKVFRTKNCSLLFQRRRSSLKRVNGHFGQASHILVGVYQIGRKNQQESNKRERGTSKATGLIAWEVSFSVFPNCFHIPQNAPKKTLIFVGKCYTMKKLKSWLTKKFNDLRGLQGCQPILEGRMYSGGGCLFLRPSTFHFPHSRITICPDIQNGARLRGRRVR